MRVFVFVNRIHEIGYRQTTALLVAAFHRKGLQVYLAGVDGLSATFTASADSESTFFANAIELDCGNGVATSAQVAEFSSGISTSRISRIEIEEEDLVLIRTNPGRDLERARLHKSFLEICQVARSRNIQVINVPARLDFFASKAAVALLPEKIRPEMLVANDINVATEFIRDAKKCCVVKPLLGSRGNDVVRIDPDRDDIQSELERFAGRSIVVQHFIESKSSGDKRVVVFRGRLLDFRGQYAGIHRLPAAGDFRANLHAGGTAHPLELDDVEREAVLTAGAILDSAGIYLAGIDLIGHKIIEFNVFSTGGLHDANRFAECDFAEQIVDGILSGDS